MKLGLMCQRNRKVPTQTSSTCSLPRECAADIESDYCTGRCFGTETVQIAPLTRIIASSPYFQCTLYYRQMVAGKGKGNR